MCDGRDATGMVDGGKSCDLPNMNDVKVTKLLIGHYLTIKKCSLELVSDFHQSQKTFAYSLFYYKV